MPIVARSASQDALKLLATALPFPEWHGDEPGDALTIQLDFVDPSAFPGWPDAAEVLHSCEAGCDQLCRVDGDPLVYLKGVGVARLFSAERRVQIVASHAAESDRFLLTQALLAPLIGPALRSWGLLALHACAVDWQGRSIIFPATSGSGKSTLALALLRAGFRLLSDDCPVLRRQADGSFHLFAYSEPVRVLPDTLDYFPELRDIHTEASGPKRLLDPAQIRPDPYATASEPALIVMPRITGQATSSIRPAPPGDALTALVSGIAFGSTGQSMARDLPVLAQFVRSCRVYTLETGTDFDRIPFLLRELLEDERAHLHA